MRIASLLASATEIVYDLGLGDQLVAISHECDFLPEALTKPRISRPRFDPAIKSGREIDAAVREATERHGSVYELDEDRLREVRPDLILAQAVCEVCAVPTSMAQQAAVVLGNRPRVVSLDCHTIDDSFASVAAVGRAADGGRDRDPWGAAPSGSVSGGGAGGTRRSVVPLKRLSANCKLLLPAISN